MMESSSSNGRRVRQRFKKLPRLVLLNRLSGVLWLLLIGSLIAWIYVDLQGRHETAAPPQDRAMALYWINRMGRLLGYLILATSILAILAAHKAKTPRVGPLIAHYLSVLLSGAIIATGLRAIGLSLLLICHLLSH